MTTTSHPQFKYLPALFVITAKTNLHSGSGGENYGIIDKMVQRDPASGFPCIYASSLKGALKEFFRDFGEDYDDMINYIFGNERKADEEPEKYKQQAGNYRFFPANLLTLPVRSNYVPFVRASSPSAINHYLETTKLLGQASEFLESVSPIPEDHKAYHFLENVSENDSILLEDWNIPASEYPHEDKNFVSEIMGKQSALVNDTDFIRLCDNTHLPIMARNSLENGRSENLWYEQIVPRQSQFIFFTLAPKSEMEHWEKFVELLTKQDTLVQFGANASIGYGFTTITKFPTS